MANRAWETLAASRLGDGFTADVQRRLEEELSRLRAAWPTLVLAPERFVARLLTQVETERPLLDWLASLHLDDLYLATACVDGDGAALALLDATYLQRVPAYLARLPLHAGR